MRTSSGAAAFLSATLLMFLGASAAAEGVGDAAQRVFDIEAQPAAAALNEFARQADISLVFSYELVSGSNTRTLKGNYTVAEALELLLEGTSLSYQQLSERTVAINRRAAKAGANADGPADSPLRLAQAEQPVGAAASAHTAAPPQDGILAEVTVTAQKRTERLQDVPSAVSVVSARRMLDSHQTRLIDYAATIPGLQVESTAAGRSTLTLRGLALHGDGSTVGTYVDDVPMGLSGPGQGSRGSALELLPYDLERIEVLRGPQGTFYGANALGGLLKYVTKAPDLRERSVSVGTDLLRITGGDDAGYTARLEANEPLVEGKLAMRASYGHDYTPGYLDIPALRRENVNESTRQTGNVALLWQPRDRLSVKLTGLVGRIDSKDNTLVRLDFATERPQLGELEGASALAQPFERTEQLYSATLKYDLGRSELTSVSSFASSKTEATTDATLTYGPVVSLLTGGAVESPMAPLYLNVGFRKYTQELRWATSDDASLVGMVGAFFTYEDAHHSRQELAALATDGTPIQGLSPLVTVDGPSTYQEEALFANLTYELSERFDVSGGVRVAKNEQKLRSLVSGPLFPADDTRALSSESVFNYSVAPRWRLNDDLMIYLRVATGYRPGGPNIVLNDASDVPRKFTSDSIVNYEAGLKSSLLAGRLQLNVAAYQIDWKDVQLGLVDFTTGTGYFDNGRRARSRGLEWESILTPTQGLELAIAASWIDAVLTEDLPENATVIGSSGDRLPNAPRFAGAAALNYRFPLSAAWNAALGGSFRYAGSHYSGLSKDPNTLRLGGYSTVDLNVGAANESWSINLFMRNVADKRGYVQKSLFTDLFTNQPLAIDAAVLQPRTFGVSIDKRF